jgi:hypothetical protein
MNLYIIALLDTLSKSRIAVKNCPSARAITARPSQRSLSMTIKTRIQSLLSHPRLTINTFLLAVFSANLVREVVYWLPRDISETSLNYWAFTDWLIDYSQGFIRRGLSGEIWRLVPDSIPPLTFVAVFSWILILAVAIGYVRLLVRARGSIHPLTMFALLFLPSLIFFYFHDHNAIARKEILGYVTVLLHLLVVEKAYPLGDGSALPEEDLRRYLRGLLPVAAILLPAIVLVHEGNFLMFVPLHGMITLSILHLDARRNFKRAALWTGLIYLPAVLAFGAVYLSGTPSHDTLFAICEKWVGEIREGSCSLPPERLSRSTLPGSFIPMSWSLGQAVGITRTIVSMHWKEWLLVLPALGFSLWYLVRQALYALLRSRCPQFFSPRSALRCAAVFFRKYFLVPLLLSLPVYFTAYDYGRWFTVTCLNFALVAVSLNLPVREFALREKKAGEEPAAAASRAHADHPLVFYGLSIAICLLALSLWLPHYCLFECDVVRSPLLYLDHTFIAH